MKHKLSVAFSVAMLVFLAVHFLNFPGSVPDFRRASGGGTLLDMTPEFSEDPLYARLTGYGEAGRANYSFRNVTTDVLLLSHCCHFSSCGRGGHRIGFRSAPSLE